MILRHGTRLSILLVLLVVSAISQAMPSSEVNGYYGREFYQVLREGVEGDDLKHVLHNILSKVHSRGTDGFDRVGQGCTGTCYQHQSVGYDYARQFLMGDFYLSRENGQYAVREVYCDKKVYEHEFKGQKPGPNKIPDNRKVNAEHTWPQSKFTGRFPTNMQKADLHHLFPTDSEMNSARSNLPFGEVIRDSQNLKCPEARIGSVAEGRGTYFEPPEGHKGNVARALFYFSVRYMIKIDPIQEKYLREWHYEDLPDQEEKERNEAIFTKQGNRNPFIDHPELVVLIEDF